jgi:hypothetical protein
MASRGSEPRAWTSLHWAESMTLAHPPLFRGRVGVGAVRTEEAMK